jgi:hypothetical protein
MGHPIYITLAAAAVLLGLAAVALFGLLIYAAISVSRQD